jgi:predicted transcriptional regulator of viral defense system
VNIETFLYEHPVFRHDEFVVWKSRQLRVVQAPSLNMALQYYLKTGRIMRIRRELYAAVLPGQAPDSVMVDPYLIAGKSAVDSVLAYHTALELHGIAYSAFGHVTYLTSQKNKPFEFQDRWFQAVSHPLILKKSQRTLFAVQSINRGGVDIFITNLARTFVDIVDRIELCGGWEEVCRALNSMAVLNVEEVIEYCLILKNACLSAKVGYFLEQRQGAFKIHETQLRPLLLAKPKTPQYVSKNKNEPFHLIKKCNILMPQRVIHQSWEEPNVNL